MEVMFGNLLLGEEGRESFAMQVWTYFWFRPSRHYIWQRTTNRWRSNRWSIYFTHIYYFNYSWSCFWHHKGRHDKLDVCGPDLVLHLRMCHAESYTLTFSPAAKHAPSLRTWAKAPWSYWQCPSSNKHQHLLLSSCVQLSEACECVGIKVSPKAAIHSLPE